MSRVKATPVYTDEVTDLKAIVSKTYHDNAGRTTKDGRGLYQRHPYGIRGRHGVCFGRRPRLTPSMDLPTTT